MDPIADMLNTIRNAQAVLKESVEIPFSNFKYEIAKILEEEKFIKKAEKKKAGKKISPQGRAMIEIALKYEDKTPAISGLKRVSKPGQKIYISRGKIKKVRGGFGINIISTSKGLMTDKEARKQKLGGEVICEVW